MKNDLYIINTLSNLHAGSGDVNFDIIDNQVQKDAVTGLPVIHSSSLKGAFREAAGEGQFTTFVFGPQSSANESHQTGAYHFFEASLLSRPVRSNKRPFYHVTSQEVITELLETLENFEIEIQSGIVEALRLLLELNVPEGGAVVLDGKEGVILEEYEAHSHSLQLEALSALLPQPLALMSSEIFNTLELPVLARNQLDEGKSNNLWYEEVVPRRSRFYYVVSKPTNLDEADAKEKLDDFQKRFDGMTSVQIGANKSIGYGVTRIQKVSL